MAAAPKTWSTPMFLHIRASDSLKSRSTSRRRSGFTARSRLGQSAVEASVSSSSALVRRASAVSGLGCALTVSPDSAARSADVSRLSLSLMWTWPFPVTNSASDYRLALGPASPARRPRGRASVE